ncbi:copper resistance protein NlpE N-terminal domain-containing protein [Luteimonas sp. SX5]|uniref:Copper resistance protein NlpE N-terminal domain-containing protein n=1 Tax=Luteimonas galliterrae TaxID=2940486 RepID=A0ABT0MIQ4_9GAMM|nr:copper resistance protein NlpE N-terminal domain-containing protein [Luteimonas galliterrae]MCL1634749.1 copper resistance protein NlpE N-terminal domain-containing protein [Luteimonas galliterrae]
MTPRLAWLLCLLLAGWLPACSRDTPAPAAALPPFDRDGRIGWRGVLACADCDGIDTTLALSRSGERREYLLVETYLTADGGERFVEQGRWRQQGDALIRLQAVDGGERVYALQADGGLQPRDARGRRFALRDDDVLTPLPASTGL